MTNSRRRRTRRRRRRNTRSIGFPNRPAALGMGNMGNIVKKLKNTFKRPRRGRVHPSTHVDLPEKTQDNIVENSLDDPPLSPKKPTKSIISVDNTVTIRDLEFGKKWDRTIDLTPDITAGLIRYVISSIKDLKVGRKNKNNIRLVHKGIDIKLEDDDKSLLDVGVKAGDTIILIRPHSPPDTARTKRRRRTRRIKRAKK